MRRTEFAVAHADPAPRLDEFSIGRELADTRRRPALDALRDGVRGRHALRVVSVGHVDAAVRADDDVVRLVELTIGVARLAGDSQTQQFLAPGAEFVHLVTLRPLLVAREISD